MKVQERINEVKTVSLASQCRKCGSQEGHIYPTAFERGFIRCAKCRSFLKRIAPSEFKRALSLGKVNHVDLTKHIRKGDRTLTKHIRKGDRTLTNDSKYVEVITVHNAYLECVVLDDSGNIISENIKIVDLSDMLSF